MPTSVVADEFVGLKPKTSRARRFQKWKGSATRKRGTIILPLKYYSGIIQPRARIKRKKGEGCATREAFNKIMKIVTDTQKLDKWTARPQRPR